MKCSCRASKLSVISSPSLLPVSCLFSSLPLFSHTLHKRPQFKLALIRSDMYTKYQALSVLLPCIVFSTWANSITAGCVVYCGEEGRKKNHPPEALEDIKMEAEEECRNNWSTLQTQPKVAVWLGGAGPLCVWHCKGPVNWNKRFVCIIQVHTITGKLTFSVLMCNTKSGFSCISHWLRLWIFFVIGYYLYKKMQDTSWALLWTLFLQCMFKQ